MWASRMRSAGVWGVVVVGWAGGRGWSTQGSGSDRATSTLCPLGPNRIQRGQRDAGLTPSLGDIVVLGTWSVSLRLSWRGLWLHFSRLHPAYHPGKRLVWCRGTLCVQCWWTADHIFPSYLTSLLFSRHTFAFIGVYIGSIFLLNLETLTYVLSHEIIGPLYSSPETYKDKAWTQITILLNVLIYLFKLHLFINVCVHVVYVAVGGCSVTARWVCRSQFSWGLVIELGSSGLAASSFPHWATLPALCVPVFKTRTLSVTWCK